MTTPAQINAVRRNAARRQDRQRPENSHVPDETFAIGDPVTAADVALDADALFACDFVFSPDRTAAGSISADGNFADGETVTIGEDVYTFVEELTGAGDVLIATSLIQSLYNLKAAINGEAGEGTRYGTGTTAHADVTALSPVDGAMRIVAQTAGTDGNSIALATDVENAEVSGETLEGGAAANQGILFSLGDDMLGLLVGVNGDGELVARFGDGGEITNGARVAIAAGLVPKDRETKLAVAVHVSDPAEIVVWFDGREAGRADLDGELADDIWAASADGAYVEVAADIPTETGITEAYDGTVLSPLRYHARRADKYRTGV